LASRPIPPVCTRRGGSRRGAVASHGTGTLTPVRNGGCGRSVVWVADAVVRGATRSVRVAPIVVRALAGRRTLTAAATFARTVVMEFFLLQFAVKWGLRKTPIVSVDHPLDETVPFTPERVGVYLAFVAFWIRPRGYIRARFGRDAERRYAVAFLALIDRCYREAARVYRVSMSTTRRPAYRRGRFRAIPLLDPHYLCVPSLHVMGVVLAYTFYRRAFAELGVDGDEAADLDRELFGGAVEITETVLYIKQHSVNCIPAALYAMATITPDDVTPAEVGAFVDRLFRDSPGVAEGDAARIRAHVRDTYAGLVADGGEASDWVDPVVRLLHAYAVADAAR